MCLVLNELNNFFQENEFYKISILSFTINEGFCFQKFHISQV